MPESNAKYKTTDGYKRIIHFLEKKGFTPFDFQAETWQHFLTGRSGMLNAPTGFGKTYALLLPFLMQHINQVNNKRKAKNGLQLLWITPLRALARDTEHAMVEVIKSLGLSLQVGVRNGDTTTSKRVQQTKRMPEILIITPESVHLLLASKECNNFFAHLRAVVVDEWHELLGSKRGVQVELALSRLKNITKTDICIWGISATIENMNQSLTVLLGNKHQGVVVKSKLKKEIEVIPVLPPGNESYPYAGHLGIRMSESLIPIIENCNSCLLFTNTRAQSEIWYHHLLTLMPELAGVMALHHGSINSKVRKWIEQAVHANKMKLVVCTSSLDLGVDFAPVDIIIQIGSPKGIARFIQRAGRSGHNPGAKSKIYFLPTNALELLECAALRTAINKGIVESRYPYTLCMDVLLQYLTTLAVGVGFLPDKIFDEIKTTYAYATITRQEYDWCLRFLHQGGEVLSSYDEFKKIEIIDSLWKVTDRKIAMRHRLSIGTIVSEHIVSVKLVSGKRIGTIEEYFISRLNAGDVFSLAGQHLEFIKMHEMTAIARKSKATKALVPSWNGGRMSLSSNLGTMLRLQMNRAARGNQQEVELINLQPLLQIQAHYSRVPRTGELLIEKINTNQGHHLFVYPFEGRCVHEAMAAILAHRLSRIAPMTFSIAINDYGFELLSDTEIPLHKENVFDMLSQQDCLAHLQQGINATEMVRRKFRDIAVIAGLVFQGHPGQQMKTRHLQSNASLFYKVFNEYDRHNLLLRQALNEVLTYQVEEARLQSALERIAVSNIIITTPESFSPFSFPLMVDRLRETISNETMEQRITKILAQTEIG